MARRIRIFVAEDDENDSILLARAVAKTPIPAHIRFARDGSDVISYLGGEHNYASRKQHPLPDILVLDLAMPRVDGFEVLEWMRTRPELEDIFIVVLSGMGSQEYMGRALRLGAHCYLTKPNDPGELTNVLQRMVGMFSEHTEQVGRKRAADAKESLAFQGRNEGPVKSLEPENVTHPRSYATAATDASEERVIWP